MNTIWSKIKPIHLTDIIEPLLILFRASATSGFASLPTKCIQLDSYLINKVSFRTTFLLDLVGVVLFMGARCDIYTCSFSRLAWNAKRSIECSRVTVVGVITLKLEFKGILMEGGDDVTMS